MARVLLQLLCTALVLTFFYYQNNAHALGAKPEVVQTFSAKRIKVSDANGLEQSSDPSKHPNVWLMPVLDRLFSNPELQHATTSLGLTFSSGKTL